MSRTIPFPPWLFVLLGMAAPPAAAQSGGPYFLSWSNVGGGGQFPATGGPYQLSGTTGQADAGPLGGGAYALHGGFWIPSPHAVTDAPSRPPVPVMFAARPPAPNPFRTTTSLAFDLPVGAQVQLTLYSVDGRLVRHLLERELAPGRHQVSWDGRDENGHAVHSGLYFARLRAGEFAATLRLVRLD